MLRRLPEPSDIVFDAATQHLFIVSDHGILYECDTSGKPTRSASVKGVDFEGVEVREKYVLVADETQRRIYKYNKSDLSLDKIYTVQWGGAINRGFESLAWNASKHCYVLVAEQPAVIVEYTEEFTEITRYPFRHTRDISSARWRNGYMYLLSDIENCLMRCDPQTYEPVAYYNFDIINPEGFDLLPSGRTMVVSDNEQKIYFFSQIQ